MIRIVHPRRLGQALAECLCILYRRRNLILALTAREIGEQYAGQVLGIYWALLHPLLMAAVYLFMFHFVFKVSVAQSVDAPLDFVAYMMAGLLPWLAMQQGMVRSCTALTSSASLVKQVVFPTEVLPIKAVLATLPGQIIMFTALVVYVLIQFGIPPATYLLLPLLLTAQLLLMQGISFAFSAINVMLRDLKDLVQVYALIGIYTMPIFYLPEWVPAAVRPVIYANPFTYLILCYQDALFYGRIAHPWAWVIFLAGSLLVFATGYRVFRRLRPWVGNML